ncbi:MAG: hypothetical protein SO119_02365 [Phascolarctobacterium sp.]|nr:hypothetical protein [Phascolarctobacterium sp.]
MNLKKAFQYQSKIAGIQSELINTGMRSDNFLIVEEKHKRSELNYYFNDDTRTYDDEVRRKKSNNIKEYDFGKLVQIYHYLTACHVKLAQAISNVKDEMKIGQEELTYDAAVLKATDLRKLAQQCQLIASKVEQESDSLAYLTFTQGTERVQANYTITVTTTPEKEVVDKAREACEKYKEEANDISDAIEAASLTCRLPQEAEPRFPITADLDYIYKRFEKYVG